MISPPTRSVMRSLCLAVLAGATACGLAPDGPESSAVEPFPAPNLQRVSFTGIASPATGQLQIFAPQAALGRIPESADGNAATVAVNSVQVYAPSVSYVSSNALYPAGCNPASPLLMLASVEIFSGYTEQLRNVYANLTATSSGSGFCATAQLGAFAPEVGTSVGAYYYPPLDMGGAAVSKTRRSVLWALSLPDGSPYFFSGDVWAEVVPGEPTDVSPADGAIAPNAANVVLSWTANDGNADGKNLDGLEVWRPTSYGSTALTILQCNEAAKVTTPYDPAACKAIGFNHVMTKSPYIPSTKLAKKYWYQWTVQTYFQLPGNSSWTYGRPVTQHFYFP